VRGHHVLEPDRIYRDDAAYIADQSLYTLADFVCSRVLHT